MPEPVPQKVRWGILGAARVATGRMLPGMRTCQYSEAAAVASRDLSKAREVARQFGIPRAYGTYEELLADPQIEAVYIPLPNHLHAPWTIRAAQAGKNVLCEKPIALNSSEVADLIQVRDQTGVKIGEAFMVRTHPRWLRARELVRSGRIGTLRAISGYFTIPLSDISNIRFNAEWGGGALMDLGCYQVTLARMLFGEEPTRAIALTDRHPQTGVDRLTSMLLEFPSGQASFTCGFETVWAQQMNLLGTKARIGMELPMSAPDNRSTQLVIDDGSTPVQVEEFPVCNQYGLHIDAFSKAILDSTSEPVALEDSLANMRVVEELLRPH